MRGPAARRRGPGPKLRPMGSPRDLHQGGTIVLSAVMAVIGVALVVQAVGGRDGAFSVRLLLGVLFIAAGALRLWIERKRRVGR